MVVQVKVGEVEVAVVEHHENLVFIVELSEEASVFIVVEAVDIGIIPYLASAKCGMAVAFQRNAVHGMLREQVTLRGTALDNHFREVLFKEELLHLGRRVEGNLDDFGLAVGVGGEVDDARTGCTLCEVILLVASHGGHVEALDEILSLAAVAVNHVVDGAAVVLLEHRHVEDVLAYENLLGHTDDLVLTVLVENDDVVEVGAVADELILLHTRSDEALLTVDVELLIGLHHLGSLDGVEVLDLREARMFGAVFVLQVLEPVGRHFGHVGQLLVNLLNLRLDAGNEFIGLVLGELGNALHLDFEQAQDIVLGYLADHLRIERREPLIDVFAEFVGAVGVLKRPSFINALFDENLLQRGEMHLLHQFVPANFEFLTQEGQCAVHGMAEHVGYREELRFVVLDDTAVG